jgi:predicted TIM-barrel fold metal-dependent hydrolase
VNAAVGRRAPRYDADVVTIDAHTHLFAPAQRAARSALAARDATFAELYADPAAKMATLPDLLAALDRAGIDGAVVAGFAFAAEADLAEQNAALFLAARETERVAALATLNPMLPGWRAMAEAAIEQGACGFGELRPGNQGWDPLGPEGHALCAFAAERAVPLLWHVSEPVGHRYPGKAGGIGPADFITLALAHPETVMVGAHLGGGAAWYLQMPEVRSAIENVYFDTAAGSLLYDMRSVARLVDLVGEYRVLFASDYPLLSPLRQLERHQALLGEAAQAVCGGNAERLFFGSRPHPGRRRP